MRAPQRIQRPRGRRLGSASLASRCQRIVPGTQKIAARGSMNRGPHQTTAVNCPAILQPCLPRVLDERSNTAYRAASGKSGHPSTSQTAKAAQRAATHAVGGAA